MESRTQHIKNSNSTNFLLRRTASMQKTANAGVKLPRLRDESAVVNRTGRMNSTGSPNKNQSPPKSSMLGSLRNQKIEKLQLLSAQEVPMQANYSESISARAWIVCQREPFAILKQYNCRGRREVASLTKMMTFVAALRIVKHFHLDLNTTYMRVTLTAIDVIGTLAELELGQWLNVFDLLQGLMLPSGNDCANVLAENLGALLFFDKMGEKNMLNGLKSIDLSEDYSNIRLYTDTFVRFMNSIARELNMKNTLFSNPHGLSGREHYSNAEDMALLSAHLLQLNQAELFIECLSHQAKIKISNNNQITIRSAVWENTNKLLEKPGFKGIKTGHTVSAGGCLASYYVSPRTGDKLIVIVLGCKSQEARFTDTQAVLELLEG